MMTNEQLKQLLDQFPTPNEQAILAGADRDAMLRTVAALQADAPQSVAALADMLTGPAQGGDTRPHHALHALAISVNAQDTQLRRAVSQALASALQQEKARPAEVKAFLIRQLQVAGGPEVVVALAPLLSDPELCEPAAQALVAIGTASAETLRRALPQAADCCRLTIAQALGVLRDTSSASALVGLLTSPDADTRLTALWGLARIADPSQADLIIKAADMATGYERIKATQACLLLAENLAAAGRRAEATRIYRHLLDTRTGDAEQYVRQAAEIGLAATNAAVAGNLPSN